MRKRVAGYSSVHVYLLILLVFWVLMFCLGYPKPHWDDLFYVGTAFHLAEQNELTNPHISTFLSGLETDKFYAYTPIHAYALSGFIRILGISTRTILTFHFVTYALFSWFLLLLLRRFRCPLSAAFFITLAYAYYVFQLGMRPNSLAFAFLMAGLYLLTSLSGSGLFLAFFCLLTAIATLPLTMALALPLGFFVLFEQHREHPYQREEMIRIVAAFAAAAATVLVVFLVAINFDVREFFRVFLAIARYRDVASARFLILFFQYMTYAWEPVKLLPLYTLFIVLFLSMFAMKGVFTLTQVRFSFALLGCILMGIFIYARNISGYVFFLICIFCIMYLFWTFKKVSLTYWAASAILAVSLVFFSQLQTIVRAVFSKTQDQSYFLDIREKLTVFEGKTIVLDGVAARYVYDFKLPEGSQAWNACRQYPQYKPEYITELRTHEVFVVSEAELDHYLRDWSTDVPKVKFFGRVFGTVPRYPYRLSILSRE